MMKDRWPRGGLVASVFLLCACEGGEPRCPTGTVPEGSSCVDSGRLDAALADGSARVDGAVLLPDGAVAPDACMSRPFYRDGDGDGFGDPGASRAACLRPVDHVENADDCDDTNAARHPGATEVCNVLDDDCDELVDEGVLLTFYRDGDGDGFGDASMPVTACSLPVGHAENAADCDDTNAGRNPAAPEVCNGADDDCDELVDEGVLSMFYRDADGDGFGDASMPMTACAVPVGYAENADDCDDTSVARRPGAPEVCNALDDDCDGAADEDFLCVRGTSVACTTICGSTGSGTCTATCVPPGSASCVPPAEMCNYSQDDDCDGRVEEGVTELRTTHRGSFAPIYDAPVGVTGASPMSFWLRGSALYGFLHAGAGEMLSSTTEVFIAGSAARYHAAGGSAPVVAYVDADGTSEGDIVVTHRSRLDLSEVWRQRITTRFPAGAGGALYTDVRVLRMSTTELYVIARHVGTLGQLREVVLARRDGAVISDRLLLGQTSGTLAVAGDATRYVVAMPRIEASGSSVQLLAGGTSGALVRSVSLGTSITPRDVAVAVDNRSSPADALLVWSELRTDSTIPRIRYAWFPGLTDTPTLGMISSTRTTPAPAPERQYLSLDFASGGYYLATVETTSAASTSGTPTVYQMLMRPGVPSLFPVGTLPAGVHRRISLFVAGCGGCVGYGYVFHNTNLDPGMSWTRFGCP